MNAFIKIDGKEYLITIMSWFEDGRLSSICIKKDGKFQTLFCAVGDFDENDLVFKDITGKKNRPHDSAI